VDGAFKPLYTSKQGNQGEQGKQPLSAVKGGDLKNLGPMYQIDLILEDPEFFLDTVVLPIEATPDALYRVQLSIVPIQR
jgi:hypothetical protein